MTTHLSREPVPESDHARGHPDGMSTRTLLAFFAITFGLCWGVASLLLVFADQLEPIFGPVSGTNPVFVLAVYAPGIAAVALVWRHSGGEVPGGGHKRHDRRSLPVLTLVHLATGACDDALYRARRGGIRLARLGAATVAASGRGAVGQPHPRCHLGFVALPGLPAQRHSAERMVNWSVRAGGVVFGGDRHPDVQHCQGQHPHSDPVSLPDEWSPMARSAACGELLVRSRGDHRGGPQSTVDAGTRRGGHQRARPRR